MAGKVINLQDIIVADQLGCRIANDWHTWNMWRQSVIDQKRELRSYVYATDTTTTSNSSLPWSNKTTLPKLTQIRDNLYANYMATLFPKRRWMEWEGSDRSSETKAKRTAIKDFMQYVVRQPEFKAEIEKLVLDYIDWGNCFGTVEWVDETVLDDNGQVVKKGYLGPRVARYSPLDIVFNPIAPTFKESPKIVRVMTNLGEATEIIKRFTADQDELDLANSVIKYCKDLRQSQTMYSGYEIAEKDEYFRLDGFSNYREYLGSGNVELLFFFGDIYDEQKDEFLKNHMVVVIDRHKVLMSKPHSYPMAEIPIYHAGWRVRQDNLWAMGPLDNLVGLQYRLDHVENMKSDLLDLVTYPPVKIKGIVNDFDWGPMEKIHVDADGDVELMHPDVNALQVNIEIAQIEQRMEEMAGSPKEAMGFRTPGEKTKYEVQRLENAASRIFQNKVAQFEEKILEPLLNAMLVLAQTHLEDVAIRVIEDEFKSVQFRQIKKSDLAANGRIKPVGARHFAEQAELVQNINAFFQSALGQDQEMKMHFSSVKLAEMFEELLDISEWEIVQPWVRLHEQAEAQQQSMAQEENTMASASAPAGLTPEDFSDDFQA